MKTTFIALAIVVWAISASATTLTLDVNLTPSGSNNNVTNGNVQTVFSDPVNFSQFDPTLGTLTSATLSWDANGSLTVGGNLQGLGIMSYQTSSDPVGWNIYGGTTTLNFSIAGSEGLSLTGLTGTGTVNEGNFAETFQNQGGYFPDSYQTGPTSGTFTLTYDYTPDSPPPPIVPEPGTITLLSSGLLGLFGVVRQKFGKNA